jgi:cyanophycinase
VGLGEDTGVIIEGGSKLVAMGSDSITVIDGSNVFYDNIAEVKAGKPISIAKLDVYLMARFDRFDLNTRTFTPAPSHGKMEKN